MAAKACGVIFCAGFEIRPLLNPVKEQLEFSQYSDEKCLFRAKKVLSLSFAVTHAAQC